ncbi:MAG: hypothetical protein IJ681_07680 [Bacteroidales bacterium]|nr:hypothetical protein [Bacteroidales bacterium]
MKQRLIYALILSVVCTNFLQAQDVVQYHNISFGNKDSVRNANVNIGLAGDVNTLHGLQAELFSSVVRQNGIGMSSSLFATVTTKDFKGLQTTGFINAVGGKMHGVQFSAIVNTTAELKGVQIAGFNNICGENTIGLQLSSVSNISMGMKGSQISAIMNVCENQLNGFQFSMFNYADTLTGNQIGLINLCVSHPHGLQIGIINYARTDSSSHYKDIKWQLPVRNRKIGLVNVSNQTNIQMLVYGGNTNKFNVASRFLNEMSYSILGIGSHYAGLNKNFSGSIFYRTGFYKKISKNIIASSDVGYYHIETFDNADQSTPERLYSLQGRINLEYKINENLSLFTSCGYEFTRYYDRNKFYNKRFLLDVGIILF